MVSGTRSGMLLLLSLTCTLNSCKKDKSAAPVIEIFMPAAGGIYHYGDTIHVKAHVHDERQITKLTCVLANGNNVPFLPVTSFSTGGSQHTIDFKYVISNKLIPSGEYRLVIFASDGETDVRGYRGLTVIEMPRELWKIYLAASDNNITTSIYRTDSLLNPGFLVSFPGDFSGSAAMTSSGMFFSAGKHTGHFYALNAATEAVEWSFANCAASGFPCYTAIDSDRERVYAGYADGRITGYDKNGIQQFSAITNQGSYPVILLNLENKLVAVEKPVTGGNGNIIVYSKPAGAPLFVLPAMMKIAAIERRNQDEVYVIGNDNGTAHIFLCELPSGNLSLRQQLPQTEIYDAAPINEYYMVLATSSGLMEFDYNSNSLVPLVPGSQAVMVKYDDAGNEIYAVSGKEFFVYGYQLHTLILLNSYSLPDTIRSMEFLYNRDKFE